MKRFGIALVAGVFALAACGDDSTGGDTSTDTGNTSDTSSPADTSNPGDTGGGDNPISSVTGVDKTGVTDPGPPDNSACTSTLHPNPGAYFYPWNPPVVIPKLAGGGDFTMSCNSCPNGQSEYEGKWRMVGVDDDGELDPSLNSTKELLYIDGNSFYSKLDFGSGVYEYRGYFFCSMQPEHPNTHVFWQALEVDQAVDGDPVVGERYQTDVFLGGEGVANLMLLSWFDELGSVNGDQAVPVQYCRIGTSVNGKPCDNPFGN